MRELAALTPDYVEILVLRELRKAGFDVAHVRVQRRAELAEPERGFVLELVVGLGVPGEKARRRALVMCRHQRGAVARDIVELLKARQAEASADVALIFSTADFAPDALAAAPDAGVALLRIADSRTVFDPREWGDALGGVEGTSDHSPAWLPTHVAQLVDRDASGRLRLRVLEAGKPEMILDAIRSGSHE